MNRDELARIVAQGESDELEFKKSTAQLPRAGETLCAFANTRGGRVLVGIGDKGRIEGQVISDGTLQEIATVLRRFEPPLQVGIERVPAADGREVLALSAEAAPDLLPCVYDGRAYQRIGASTSVMPQEAYQRLLLERAHARHRWENRPATGIGLNDLDLDEVRRTASMAIGNGRLPATTPVNDAADLLDRFGLRIDGELLNAAAVLFGRKLLPDYPQCQLRLARFRGTTKNEFADQRQLNGHALMLLEEATAFLERNLPVAGRIEPGVLERQDKPLFPPLALREALVNAFCHRDYAVVGGAISVAIFDDRLEVWSTGKLPFGLRVEDLARDHRSLPRNPLIAEVFYRRGLIERWGRGTQTIIELCIQAGHPAPEFMEVAGDVGVRFIPAGYVAPHKVEHRLTSRQRQILHELSAMAPQSFAEIRAIIDPAIPERTLRNDLQLLKRLGLIGSKGHGRGATWFLDAAASQAGKRPE
ncbi:MAG: ATP-binding protein [Terriglobales bacterium]